MENLNQYDPGAVAVKEDSIIAVGPEAQIKKEYSANETIDCGGKVLMPGLINAHTHVPLTLLRGLADDLRLDVWLMGYMLPVEREFVSPEFVRLGTLLACAEQIRSGVTTFNDMYFFEDDVAQATADAGMRAVCGQSIMKYPAPDAAAYEDSLAWRVNLSKVERSPADRPCDCAARAPTPPPEILRACADIAKEFDVPLHIHISKPRLKWKPCERTRHAR